MKQLHFQCLPLFADAIITDMMVHRILTSMISVLTTDRHELNMVRAVWCVSSAAYAGSCS